MPGSISTASAQGAGARSSIDQKIPLDGRGSAHARQPSQRGNGLDQPIDPVLIKPDQGDELGRAEALKAWTRFRFVRAGWFTAEEAIDYIV